MGFTVQLCLEFRPCKPSQNNEMSTCPSFSKEDNVNEEEEECKLKPTGCGLVRRDGHRIETYL